MKRIIFAALSLSLFAMGSVAQNSKVDLGGRARLRQMSLSARSHRVGTETAGSDTLRGFIILNEGKTAAALSTIDGVEVSGGRGPIALARFTRAGLAQLEQSDAVKGVRLERPVDAKLNLVRSLTGIDKIHKGTALPQPYTGRGVICSLVDGGFDPNHVNFLDTCGKTRVECFIYFRPTQLGGYNTEAYLGDYVSREIDTETAENFHGTHTMGIMGGSYKGNVTMGTLLDNGGLPTATVVETPSNPYYGIATDAGLVAAAGAGTDLYVAEGINQILNYAFWKKNQEGAQIVPVVLNLSIGSNVGPHDGTSTLARYIDAEVDGCMADGLNFIPVLSSGNEGDQPIALHKVFAEGDCEMKTTLKSLDLDPMEHPQGISGQVYLYSDSAEPFEVQAVVINKERGKVVAQNVLAASPDGAQRYLCSDEDYFSDDSTDKVDGIIKNYFTGYLGVMAAMDNAESGRYMSVIDVMLWNKEANNGNYVVGFIVKGKPGQRVDAYCSGEYFDLSSHGMAADGYLDGMTDGTLSDIACGKNTIVVGSYNSRNDWAGIDGNVYGYADGLFDNNRVSHFTSYATLADGRSLPHVCAPGATVISSTNEYYLDNYQWDEEPRQAVYESDGRKYSWQQCTGTSMSAPVVAGSIALWLEANPRLTLAEARDIAIATARRDDDTALDNQVQWGAGKFDAYAGLLEVISRSASIVDIDASASTLMVNCADGLLQVELPGASSLDVKVYNPAGQLMATATAPSHSLRLAASLPSGIYIVNVNKNHTAKISIK